MRTTDSEVKTMNSIELMNELQLAIRSKIPVIAIKTKDEQKTFNAVKEMCNQFPVIMITWSAPGFIEHKYLSWNNRTEPKPINDIMDEINGSTNENTRKVYVMYDLLDYMATHPDIKRRIYDFADHPQNTVIITFNETHVRSSVIYPLYHMTGLSTSDVIKEIEDTLNALHDQQKHLHEKSESGDQKAITAKNTVDAKLVTFDAKLVELNKQLKKYTIKSIAETMVGLTAFQVRNIIAKCLVKGDFSIRSFTSERDKFKDPDFY